VEQMGQSCSVGADDAVGAPDARSGEFDHGGFRRRETLDLFQVRKVDAGVGWQCWSVDLFGVMDDVDSSLTGGAHPGGCGRGTASRDHGLHTRTSPASRSWAGTDEGFGTDVLSEVTCGEFCGQRFAEVLFKSGAGVFVAELGGCGV
jgi:hypothetical protein